MVIHREIHSHQEEKMIMKSQIIQTKTFLQIVVDEVAKINLLQLVVIRLQNWKMKLNEINSIYLKFLTNQKDKNVKK